MKMESEFTSPVGYTSSKNCVCRRLSFWPTSPSGCIRDIFGMPCCSGVWPWRRWRSIQPRILWPNTPTSSWFSWFFCMAAMNCIKKWLPKIGSSLWSLCGLFSRRCFCISMDTRQTNIVIVRNNMWQTDIIRLYNGSLRWDIIWLCCCRCKYIDYGESMYWMKKRGGGPPEDSRIYTNLVGLIL